MIVYVDLDILICRCYFGQHSDKYKKFKDEWDYLTSNVNITYNPDKIVPICSGYSFRHFITPTYKSNRKSDPALTEFKSDIIEQYDVYRDPLLEADDILTLLATDEDYIITVDKDIRMLRNTLDFDLVENKIKTNGIEFKQIINGDRGDGVNPLMSDKASDSYIEDYFNGEWSLDTCIMVMKNLGLNDDDIVNRFFTIKILEPMMLSEDHIQALKQSVNNGVDFKVSISILNRAFGWLFKYIKTMGAKINE